jgi:hypothetical protein
MPIHHNNHQHSSSSRSSTSSATDIGIFQQDEAESESQATNIGIFQQDEDDDNSDASASLPDLIARTPKTWTPDDGSSTSDDSDWIPDGNSTDSDSEDSVPLLPSQLRRTRQSSTDDSPPTPRSPSPDEDSEEESHSPDIPQTHYELDFGEPERVQPHPYGNISEATSASSGSLMSKSLNLQDVSDFPIRSINIPTASTTATDIGTSHSQILESWREIFNTTQEPMGAPPDTAPTPDKATEPPAGGSHKRFRQQTIQPIGIDNNEPHGDTMREKEEGLSRFYWINPNGISYQRGLLDFQEILQSLRDNHIDGYGLPEINLDGLQPEIRKLLEDIAQEFYGTAILALSTSSLRSRTPYKPGGTLTGISNELCGRFQSSGSDPHGLGRWSFIQLTAKDGKSLVVVTAYRVCNANIGTSGASTAFHQQWNLLRQKGILIPNPRKQFIKDLIIEVNKWKSAGADIILGGDFNERLGDTQDGLAHLVTACDLADPHATFHGTDGEPSTYSRGSKRLDYVFVTQRVLQYIKYCGIDPFHQVLFTDHRGLFLDIDLKGLLGSDLAHMVPAKARGVSSHTDKPEVYITALHEHLTANNVFNNSAKIFTKARESDRASDQLVEAINKIDRTLTFGMLLAEIRCRRKPRPAWSSALAAASRTLKFWKTLVSGLKTNTNVTATLHQIGKFLKWDDIPADTQMEEAKAAQKEAFKGLSKCRKEAKELRKEFLDDRIEEAAKAEDTTSEKLLKKLRHREAQTACFNKLANALKPAGHRGGVTKVEITVDGKTIAYTEKKDVDREVKNRNRHHFNDPAGSPFTVFPLSEVGVTETNFQTSHLPDGREVRMPVGTFIETETILDLLKTPLPGAIHANISSRISLGDFLGAIKVWKERTSTSPSGRHLGHYKLLVKAYESRTTTPEVKSAVSDILNLMVDMMDLASDKGFILKRWTKVVNVMIYKKPGVFLLEKLRVIHLFEADYNFIIGTIFGRRAMYSGVDNGTLHSSQWAQPGRQCADVIIMRELTLGVAKLTKTPMAGFENDASACYDRIVMNLVSAIFDRMGVPPGPLRLQEQTLKRVVHFLKTGFGLSTFSYTSDAIFRIYGVGQGSKAGPVSWAAVSSLLFEAQDILGTGLTLQNPARTITHKRHSDGYVDDTTEYHGKMQEWITKTPPIRTVFDGLNADAQIWERLLWTTGGKLALDKCKFYIIYWKFAADGRGSLMTKAELNMPPLMLTEGDSGNYQTVEQLDVDDAFKTLGIHKTISGDQTVQISEMKKKSDAYARGILSVSVTNFEAWTGLFTIWLAQMNYPLAVTSLKEKECKAIQSKAVNASLSKCGFSRKMSRDVVFGSPWYGGLGWRHLFFEQGIQHVMTIIKHLRTPGEFNRVLLISLQWYQKQAGVCFSPFRYPNAPLPYLEHEWLDGARLFLHLCLASLDIPEIVLPIYQRINDSCIMTRFIGLALPKIVLERLNCCRKWLQVTQLSDICTLKGDTIDRKAWLGIAPMTSDNDDWPVQPRPHDKVWSLWRTALSKSVCHNPHRYVLSSRPGILKAPLGPWESDSDTQSNPRWTTYFSHSSQRLYIPVPTQPESLRQLSTPTRLDFSLANYDLRDTPILIAKTDLPNDAVPAQPTTSGQFLRVNRPNTPTLLTTPIPAPIQSFSDYIYSLPKWKHELLKGICNYSPDADTLINHLRQGTLLLMCSDGGATTTAGSFGWVLATATTLLWEGSGPATGWAANSFRSEGVGQLSLLVFLEAFLDYYQIKDIQIPQLPPSTPWIRSATDNKGLIARIQTGLAKTPDFAGAGLNAEYDIVHEIVAITRRLPIPLVWEHVKGHQDEKRQWYELTRMETLNVHADALATTALEANTQPARTIHMIPSSKVALRIAGTDITSHYATHLRKAATRPAMLRRGLKHYGWTTRQFDSIDWKAHHGAIQKLRFSEKKFVTKFIHQSLPMGKIFHKIDPSQSITCSSCKRLPESETHLYRCPARQFFMDDVFLGDILQTFLQDEHTCPRLAYTLLTALYSDLSDDRLPEFKNKHGANDPPYRKLHDLQAQVGWSQLFQGRLVKEWSILQDAFLESHKKEFKIDRRYYTGAIWARKLVSLLWAAMRDCWNHRNGDRHGKTKEENHSIRHTRVMGQIAEQYAQGPLMLAADRDIISEPLQAKEDRSPAALELWLERNATIVKLSTKAATAAIIKTHASITKFFHRGRPPDHPTPPTPSSQEGDVTDLPLPELV